jgi:hypothetical protein
MWHWRRRSKSSAPEDEAEQFHREVQACTRALNRKVLALTDKYSIPAVAVALSRHVNIALRACIERREITESQARRLVERLSEPEFVADELERDFRAQAALRGSHKKR